MPASMASTLVLVLPSDPSAWATTQVLLLQEKEWGVRGWSHPRSQVSPWDGRQVWVLGFAQERIQEQATVK